MTETPSMKKTFEDAHAADASAHRDKVQQVLGEAKTLGKDFDEIWPKAVPVLDAVAGLVRFIPGVGVAAPVISGLVAVGNALHDASTPSA
jgi:hypothetical protein